MVQLPRLSVTDGIALGTALVTRSKSVKGPLPVPIRKSLRWMQGSLMSLSESAMSRIAEAAEDSLAVQDAKQVLDASWSGAYHWCRGLARLPDKPEISGPAAQLRDTLFVDGLRFTQARYKNLWVESHVRLHLIDARGLDQVFADLGGQPILDSIRRAHERYGEVLGITECQDQDDEVPAGTRLREFLDDLRCYVVRVVAHVDRDDESTRELADFLLAPLKEWKSASTGSGGTTDEPEPAEVSDALGALAASPSEPDALDTVRPAGLLSSPAIAVPPADDDLSD
jgi:hypothetical protein